MLTGRETVSLFIFGWNAELHCVVVRKCSCYSVKLDNWALFVETDCFCKQLAAVWIML